MPCFAMHHVRVRLHSNPPTALRARQAKDQPLSERRPIAASQQRAENLTPWKDEQKNPSVRF
jgi:hypothetical protein